MSLGGSLVSSNVYVNGIIAHQDLVDVQALAAGVCKDQGYSGPEQVTDRLVTGQKMGTIESRIWNPDKNLTLEICSDCPLGNSFISIYLLCFKQCWHPSNFATCRPDLTLSLQIIKAKLRECFRDHLPRLRHNLPAQRPNRIHFPITPP